jgi:hypothetical protein
LSDVTEPFALRLQLLPSTTKKVLVGASLVASQQEGRFTVGDLRGLFERLAIPVPNNLNASLNTLKGRELVYSLPSIAGAWTLTPLGIREADDLMGSLDPTALELGSVGAEFAHVRQTVIPWWAAPPRWQIGIRRLTERHPFETNVFIMTRFPSEGAPESPPDDDPVRLAISTIRSALEPYGLTAHTAADGLLEDDLLTNVGSYMWGSKYGIGILEDRVGRGLNYNAVIELGGMVLTGRRCALLRDDVTGDDGEPLVRMPTDLTGHVYKSVNLDDPETVAQAVQRWASDDLGLSLLASS